MEIESKWRSAFFNDLTKQRKSPENGDWKVFALLMGISKKQWNKESLLKMEIESDSGCPNMTVNFETKKVSWKWRLKAFSFLATGALGGEKQRKSPENGDWKRIPLLSRWIRITGKQRKSPENGDWKQSVKKHVFPYAERNKESLLKMEIERQGFWRTRTAVLAKKQRKSPENGDWKMFSTSDAYCEKRI